MAAAAFLQSPQTERYGVCNIAAVAMHLCSRLTGDHYMGGGVQVCKQILLEYYPLKGSQVQPGNACPVSHPACFVTSPCR
jgi:hypothetical protein